MLVLQSLPCSILGTHLLTAGVISIPEDTIFTLCAWKELQSKSAPWFSVSPRAGINLLSDPQSGSFVSFIITLGERDARCQVPPPVAGQPLQENVVCAGLGG